MHRAVMRAMRDSGIRGFFGRATRDLNPDSGWRDPWYLPLDEVFDQMRTARARVPERPARAERAAGARHGAHDDGRRAASASRSTRSAEGCQITIHMGEHTEERETAIDRWGIGAFQKGEEIGFLGPEVVAAHCVKLDRRRPRGHRPHRARRSRTTPSATATSATASRRCSSMLEMGIDVSLATDGGACGNTEDMLEALKFGVLQPKAAAQDPRVFNARDILRARDRAAARARSGCAADLGALEVGRLADLFLFDPYRLKTVPMHDPISTLVYTGSQSNVDTVIVDGNVVLDAGRFPNIDEEAFVREVQERALALAQRVGTFRLMRGRRFTPFRYDRVGTDRRPSAAPRPGGRRRGPRGRAAAPAAPTATAARRRAAPERPAAAREAPASGGAGALMLLDNCTVVTMDAERRILRDAAIAIQGNSIAAVGKSSEIRPLYPDEPVRDLHGWVVTPGLVDGHVHLPQAILRGCGDEVPLWVWMTERIFILEGAFTAEDARISMRLAALEMLKAGTTAFLETLILGRHDARRPRRGGARRPACAPCCRARSPTAAAISTSRRSARA